MTLAPPRIQPPATEARHAGQLVRNWLDTHAPVVLTSVMGFPARASALRAGRTAHEFWWTAPFLAGLRGASPVRPVPQWSASLLVAGRPVGVVSLRLAADGAVRVSHLTQDAALAAALQERGTATRLVTDLINGPFLLADDVVWRVGAEASPPAPLHRVQAALVAQQARLRQAVHDIDGPAAGCPDPIDMSACA